LEKESLIKLLKEKNHPKLAQAIMEDSVDKLSSKDKQILLNLSQLIQNKAEFTPQKINMGMAGGSPSAGSPGWIGGSRD